MLSVCTVLRQSHEYTPDLVVRLAKSVNRHLPGIPFFCLSDVPVPGVTVRPLVTDWPGWWAKMELFRPDLIGDLLFFDLDTMIIGSLEDIANVNRLTLLEDFYRPTGLGSGMMYIPQDKRARVWASWVRNPLLWMDKYKAGGDQSFLEQAWPDDKAARWQDLVGSQVLSYKAHIRPANIVPKDTRVVCFHGQPRPWDINWRLPPRAE